MKIDSYIKEQFGIKDVDIRTYSPLTHLSRILPFLYLRFLQYRSFCQKDGISHPDLLDDDSSSQLH